MHTSVGQVELQKHSIASSPAPVEAAVRNESTTWRVFGFYWFGHGSIYLLRKPLGVIKGSLARDLEVR